MAGIEPLISPRDLLTTRLARILSQPASEVFINYDHRLDTLMLLFASPDTETFVHYLDDSVGLLCETESLEVVGFQIEAFAEVFVPEHADVAKVWRLSESGVPMKDLGDLFLTIEQRKPTIAREIIKVTQSVLLDQHVPLKIPALA